MKQQAQETRRTIREALFLGAGFFLPGLALLLAGVLTPLQSRAVLGSIALLVLGIIYLLFWILPPKLVPQSLAWLLFLNSFFLPSIITYWLLQGFSSVEALQAYGFDKNGRLALTLVCGFLSCFSLMMPLRRKWYAPRAPEGEHTALAAEVTRAFARERAGWGLTPAEARNRGFAQLALWLILGGCWLGAGIALLSILGLLPVSGPGLLYQLLGLVMILGGLRLVLFITHPGIGLLRLWWRWRKREQASHLEGTLENIWCSDAASPAEPGNLSIIQLRLPDGSSKLLAAKAAAFHVGLTEEHERVEIAYQTGNEAVLSITRPGTETKEVTG